MIDCGSFCGGMILLLSLVQWVSSDGVGINTATYIALQFPYSICNQFDKQPSLLSIAGYILRGQRARVGRR